MAGSRHVKKLLTIASLLLCLALPARAQETAPAPFDGDLARLAEIMGAQP
jgi:predicted secreted protein